MFSLGWLLQIIPINLELSSCRRQIIHTADLFCNIYILPKKCNLFKTIFKILLKICSWPWFDFPNTFIFLRLVNHLPLHKSRKSIGNSWRHELTAKLWNITEVLSITILLLMHHTGIYKLTLLICCCTCSFDIYYNKQKTTFDKIISFWNIYFYVFNLFSWYNNINISMINDYRMMVLVEIRISRWEN